MSTLQYSSSTKGGVTIIKIGGNLDIQSAPKLNTKLGEAIDGGVKNIILNLADVDYIASAGLGAIVSNNGRLRKQGGEILISGMSDKIQKIFKLLGFLHLFKTYKNDEEAINSYK